MSAKVVKFTVVLFLLNSLVFTQSSDAFVGKEIKIYDDNLRDVILRKVSKELWYEGIKNRKYEDFSDQYKESKKIYLPEELDVAIDKISS